MKRERESERVLAKKYRLETAVLENENVQDVKVAYTSVAPAGFGLYAMRDFKEGEFLPVYYNGLTISDKEANRMEDYILAMSNAVPGPTKKQIQELKDRWGIDIALNGSRDELGTWDYKGPEHEINWNRLYDNYFDYAFGYYDPDIKKNLHVYWSDYNYTGEPTIDHLVAENAALFVNEPPDADYYYNQLLQEYMPVNSNLESTYNPKLKKLGLKTTRPVLAGEEFFLCYGLLYQRGHQGDKLYHINTSPLYGCGKRYDLESYLVKNYDESQPLIKQINKQTLARLEKMPEISRKNFLLYILLVQKSIEREKQTNGQRSKDRTYRNEISNRKRRMLSYLKNEIAERKTLENQQNKRLK